jgi:hypothetical protein
MIFTLNNFQKDDYPPLQYLTLVTLIVGFSAGSTVHLGNTAATISRQNALRHRYDLQTVVGAFQFRLLGLAAVGRSRLEHGQAPVLAVRRRALPGRQNRQQARAGLEQQVFDDGALRVVRVEGILRAAEARLNARGQVLQLTALEQTRKFFSLTTTGNNIEIALQKMFQNWQIFKKRTGTNKNFHYLP